MRCHCDPCRQELVEAQARHDALSHAKRGLEQAKSELEAKVAQAAAALNAAEELKELRWAVRLLACARACV